MKIRIGVVALMSLGLALPMFAETYKNAYPVPCGDLWSAVKDTLGNPQNYEVKKTDESKMTASYKVKHSIHITITESILQRTNKVTLVPMATGCEMQVVSNYSGIEHDDRGDFKKRVDESLAKPKAEQPPERAAEQEEPAK
jgi:hypothetical protein